MSEHLQSLPLPTAEQAAEHLRLDEQMAITERYELAPEDKIPGLSEENTLKAAEEVLTLFNTDLQSGQVVDVRQLVNYLRARDRAGIPINRNQTKELMDQFVRSGILATGQANNEPGVTSYWRPESSDSRSAATPVAPEDQVTQTIPKVEDADGFSPDELLQLPKIVEHFNYCRINLPGSFSVDNVMHLVGANDFIDNQALVQKFLDRELANGNIEVIGHVGDYKFYAFNTDHAANSAEQTGTGTTKDQQPAASIETSQEPIKSNQFDWDPSLTDDEVVVLEERYAEQARLWLGDETIEQAVRNAMRRPSSSPESIQSQSGLDYNEAIKVLQFMQAVKVLSREHAGIDGYRFSSHNADATFKQLWEDGKWSLAPKAQNDNTARKQVSTQPGASTTTTEAIKSASKEDSSTQQSQQVAAIPNAMSAIQAKRQGLMTNPSKVSHREKRLSKLLDNYEQIVMKGNKRQRANLGKIAANIDYLRFKLGDAGDIIAADKLVYLERQQKLAGFKGSNILAKAYTAAEQDNRLPQLPSDLAAKAKPRKQIEPYSYDKLNKLVKKLQDVRGSGKARGSGASPLKAYRYLDKKYRDLFNNIDDYRDQKIYKPVAERLIQRSKAAYGLARVLDPSLRPQLKEERQRKRQDGRLDTMALQPNYDDPEVYAHASDGLKEELLSYDNHRS